MSPFDTPEKIKALLKNGDPVPDSHFDSLYPPHVTRFSLIHWTPVRVALAASALFQKFGRQQILDVGAGCGKFCLVTALSSNMNVTGAEQRGWLCDAAKETAEKLKVTRANFLHVDALQLDWHQYDALYFFNPFFERKTPSIRMDQTIPLGLSNYNSCVKTVAEKLLDQERGTLVATYHGMGGPLPLAYKHMDTLPCGTLAVELWQRR